MIQTKIFYPRQLLLIRSEIELKEGRNRERGYIHIHTADNKNAFIFFIKRKARDT